MFNELLQYIRQTKKESIHINLQDRDLVLKNLVFIYHTSVATEKLLMDAAIKAISKVEHTDIGLFIERIHEYYHKHSAEEKDESEVLLQDLQSVRVYPGLPDRYAMAMIGSQYYMINHLHPVCLLGYLAVQEADFTKKETVDILADLYGENLCRFMRMHVERDPEHARELGELIEEVPKPLQQFVIFSADNVLMHYAEAIKSWKD